jgi:hypothetical protein
MPQSTNAQDAPASSPAQPLASWYAQGMSDGLGDRLLMFDNSEAPSLELLRFHQELAQAPGFESALREQVRRLARFQHPAFARVRSVQRLEPDDDLALISNVTDGKRLSEVLHRARGPAAAAALIRQLAPALAQFQQHGDGNAHGLLDPNRIVVSPEGRLTIVEHAVGPAIEALALRHFQLAGMGIPLPPAPEGSSARLDAATDWYQLGLVALSVLIGRPVTPADVPEIDRLLDELEASSGTDQAALSPLLRQWLERALRISGERIETSADGQAALDELLQREEPRDTRRLEAQQEEAASSSSTEPARPLTAAELHRAAIERVLQAVAAAAAAAPEPVQAPDPHRQTRQTTTRDGEPPTRTEVRRPPAPERSSSSQDMLSAFERESLVGRPPRAAPAFTAGAYAPAVPSPGSTPSASTEPERRQGSSTTVVAALVLVVLVQAGAILWLARAVWFTPQPPVVVTTDPSGASVAIESRSAGPAPIRLASAPDLGWVRVTTPQAAGVLGSRAADGAGTVRISSPIPLKVLEGSRVLGSVPGADLELDAGRHEIDLVNDALGYRSRQALDVEPGQSVTIHVAPPHGFVTIDASPWADVTLDGKAIGRTPLGPLPLGLGEHVITFTHPTGGSDRQRVTVKSEESVRVVGKLR